MNIKHWISLVENLNNLQCDPVYDHDCAQCVFCGQTAFRGHNMVDVYACKPDRPDRDQISVVLRHSDEGGGYASMPYKDAQQNPAYRDAIELVNQKLAK